MARKQRAAERRAEQWAECRRRHEEEERQRRVMVITEFDAGDPEATLHALADEVLRYRCCVRQLVDAVEADKRRRGVRSDSSRPFLAPEACPRNA
jgi:hypothetical protein